MMAGIDSYFLLHELKAPLSGGDPQQVQLLRTEGSVTSDLGRVGHVARICCSESAPVPIRFRTEPQVPVRE